MTTSHRQIFRASAIIGSASVFKVGIGVASTKVVALMLGPVGIGLLGLFHNILQVASTLAGLGLSNSGVRQLAASHEDPETISLIRKALFFANLLLGISAALILWSVRNEVAQWVLGGRKDAEQVGYLGVGVLLTLLSTSQTAVLQGLRRLGDLARVQIFSALVGAFAGVAAVWLWRDAALVVFVLAVPTTSIVIAAWYSKKLQMVGQPLDWVKLREQWQALLSLGIPLMFAGLLTLVVQLITRSWVAHALGLESAGYFQAAWLISMSYLGFVLNAMGTDYYPRLTGVIHDKSRAAKLVNDQTEMLVLMAAPILIMILTFAPWVIVILYSKEFTPAAEILQWQTLGDILKVMTWPMGFVVLAQGRGTLFVATQLNWNAWYLLIIWLGLPVMGLTALGVAYFVAFLAQFLVVYLVVKKLIIFRPEIKNTITLMVLLVTGGILVATSYYSKPWMLGIGGLILTFITYYSYRELNSLLHIGAWLKSRGSFKIK